MMPTAVVPQATAPVLAPSRSGKSEDAFGETLAVHISTRGHQVHDDGARAGRALPPRQGAANDSEAEPCLSNREFVPSGEAVDEEASDCATGTPAAQSDTALSVLDGHQHLPEAPAEPVVPNELLEGAPDIHGGAQTEVPDPVAEVVALVTRGADGGQYPQQAPSGAPARPEPPRPWTALSNSRAQQQATEPAPSYPVNAAPSYAVNTAPTSTAAPASTAKTRPITSHVQVPGLVGTVQPEITATPTDVARPAQQTPSPPSYPSLAGQILKPAFSLTAAAPGKYAITVQVAPEDLGPVTVKALVTHDGMRVELFAPNDAGREALKAVLPELRREFSSPTMQATVDISSGDPEPGAGAGTDRGRERRDFESRHPASADRQPEEPQPERTVHTWHSTSTIDLLA